MNTEKPNRQTDELEQDFSDVDLALDIDPEPDVTVEQFGSELVPHVTAEAFGSELAPDAVFAEDDAINSRIIRIILIHVKRGNITVCETTSIYFLYQ